MKNVPEKIYLQIDADGETPEDFKELSGVSWCADKVHDNDIAYIREPSTPSPVKAYVVNPISEYEPKKGELSIPLVNDRGLVSQQFVFDTKNLDQNKWFWLKPVIGYVVSEEEYEQFKQSQSKQ